MRAADRPISLRLDPDRIQRDAVRSLARAAVVIAFGAIDGTTRSDAVLRRRGWEDDRAARLVIRSPQTPTTTADAAALTQVAYSFFDVLAPISAGAAVLERALGVSFDGSASISLPTLAPGVAGFVAPGAAIPVKSFPSAAATMEPHKLACLVELTNEMLNSANAEVLVRAALTESAARGLDAVLFDANAGSAIRPPGLRFGVAGLTPAAAGAKDQAMIDDCVALAGAVSGFAGEIVFVCANKQALAFNLRSLRTFSYSILPSAAVADGMVIAINLAVLAAAFGAVEIDAGRGVGTHEYDPGQEIVTAAGAIASPIRSSFQTDSTVLRLRQQISWTLRASGGVSWMTGVTW
jgi:hypothetical protein